MLGDKSKTYGLILYEQGKVLLHQNKEKEAITLY